MPDLTCTVELEYSEYMRKCGDSAVRLVRRRCPNGHDETRPMCAKHIEELADTTIPVLCEDCADDGYPNTRTELVTEEASIDPDQIARAIGDPGSILPRIHASFGDAHDETATEWTTRAVLAVITNPATPATRSTQSDEPAQPQGQMPPKRETDAQADEAAFEIALDALQQRDIGKLLAEVVARVVDATAPQLVQYGRQQGREAAARDLERRFIPYYGHESADDIRTTAARIARGEPATEEPTHA